MAKSRSVISGPRWPRSLVDSGAPQHQSPGSQDALDESIILIGQIESDDGGSHDYDTIEFRLNSCSLVGTLRVGFADIDAASGPPGRDDGTIDNYVDHALNNPGASNYSAPFTTGGARTLADGDQIAVVFKVQAFTSGALQVFSLNARAVAIHRPVLTSFLGGAYAAITSCIPTLSLKSSADGHYAVLRGGVPHLTAAPATVSINTGTAIKRGALAFTVAATSYGMKGVLYLTNVAGGDFSVRLYDGTSLISGCDLAIDANTWPADAASRFLEFCFPDVTLEPGHTYYLSVVPTTANSVTYYTAESTTDERWDPLTGAKGGGTIGYATFDGSAWSAIDESVMPWAWTWHPVAIADGAGGGGSGTPQLIGTGPLVRV